MTTMHARVVVVVCGVVRFGFALPSSSSSPPPSQPHPFHPLTPLRPPPPAPRPHTRTRTHTHTGLLLAALPGRPHDHGRAAVGRRHLVAVPAGGRRAAHWLGRGVSLPHPARGAAAGAVRVQLGHLAARQPQCACVQARGRLLGWAGLGCGRVRACRAGLGCGLPAGCLRWPACVWAAGHTLPPPRRLCVPVPHARRRRCCFLAGAEAFRPRHLPKPPNPTPARPRPNP